LGAFAAPHAWAFSNRRVVEGKKFESNTRIFISGGVSLLMTLPQRRSIDI
jgi:hypothetical protein